MTHSKPSFPQRSAYGPAPSPRRTRLAASLMTVLSVCVAVTQSLAAVPKGAVKSTEGERNVRPRLLVSILVEGLDANSLGMLRESFGPDGFNRLMRESLRADGLDYGAPVDAAAATAIIATGAHPALNGIVSALVADPATGTVTDALLDPAEMGNFTSVTLSPRALAVSNLADELRIATAGASRVWTLSPDPYGAILQAGHAGNSAFWVDDATAKWATSTYYKDVPQQMSRRNYSAPLSARLDTMRWTPGEASLSLSLLPPSKRRYSFSHTFPASDPARVDRFKTSPAMNREITDAAIEYINASQTGATPSAPDMIGLTYTLSPYPYTRGGDQRHELYDAYIKLDAELARLLRAMDAGGAMPGSVVMLAGLPATTGQRRDDEQWRIPWGSFAPKKAIGLLNMYLMAMHGNGDWVKGYHDKQFFLNRKLIEERKLSLSDLRHEAATFLSRMSGVSSAVTLDEALLTPARDFMRPASAGDVIITIAPGWEVEDAAPAGSRSHRPASTERAASPSMPLFIMAPGLKAARLEGTPDARRVAPTVARLLRIRSPGGASEPPLL